MAKSKKDKEDVVQKFEDGNYKFFSSEIERLKNVKVFSASELDNPKPNYTGSYSLDYDLAIPVPAGRYIEIFGEESAGKSSLALEIIGQALKKGKSALYVNLELNLNKSLLESIRTLKPWLAKAIEGDKESPFQILQAPNGESALEGASIFASHFPESIIVIDSVDACVSEAVLAEDIGTQKMGNLAKLMSDALRKMLIVTAENKVSIVFINQMRDKMTMYGNPSVTSGGKGLLYYASQRIQLQKPNKECYITDADGNVIGQKVRYKIIKNKCAPQGIEGDFPLLYYNGIFREQELVNMCVKFGILRQGGKGGNQVLLPKLDDNGKLTDETVAVNKLNAARRLLLDPRLTEHLDKELRAVLGATNISTAVDEFIHEAEDAE